jgi:exonuclease III
MTNNNMRFHKGRWWSSKFASRTASSVPEFSAFSLNVNGLNKSSKRNWLSSMRKTHNWSVLFLSDTRIHTEKDVSVLNKSLGCKSSPWSLGTPHVGGTAILFFQTVQMLATFSDSGGNFSRADFVWEGETFSFVCIYAPADPSKRKRFLSETLARHLQNHPLQEKRVFAGDFNFVENPQLDRKSSTNARTAGLDEWLDCTESLLLTGFSS